MELIAEVSNAKRASFSKTGGKSESWRGHNGGSGQGWRTTPKKDRPKTAGSVAEGTWHGSTPSNCSN